MNGDLNLLLPILLPLLALPLILVCAQRPRLREVWPVLAGLATVAVLLQWWPGAQTREWPTLSLLEMAPGLSLSLALEPLGLLFGLIAASLWVVVSLFAAGYMRTNKEPHQTRFFACFPIAIAAAQLVALSGNLLTLFVGYEILTLSTYPLVVHRGDKDARRGGRVYLGYLLATSIGLLLPAIIWTYQISGNLDFRAGGILAGSGAGPAALTLLYCLFMFGTGKAALMPMHRWLPAAMVAPAPVSALLHAVAVVKAGVFVVLKVSVYVFGLDLVHSSGAARPVLWVAAFSLVAASVIALRSDNLKRRLAYSTVSQLAYVTVAAALAVPAAVIGGGLQILMHAFAKITLFMCAGAIYLVAHKINVSELDGLGRRMPLTFAAFTLAALSIIGLPPLGGSWTKWWLFIAAADSQTLWLMAVLAASTLLNIAYLLPIPLRGFLAGRGPWVWQEARWICVLPLCATALSCVALFFFSDYALQLLAPLAEP